MAGRFKPCPFCGSDSIAMHYNGSRVNRFFYFVQCEVCGARTRGESIAYSEQDEENEWNNRACEKSADCWNLRAVNQNA